MLLLILTLTQQPPTIELRSGMVITHSVRIIPKTYRISGPITLKGDDLTVDFQGATLLGIAREADPDLAGDTAILIDGGRHVRILDARVRGYRIGILARGTHDR